MFPSALALLALAALLAGAKKTPDDRPDPWVTMKTKMALLSEIGSDALNINVDTIGGRVTLHGKVEEDADRAEAERVATGILGVHSVKNLVQVVPDSVEDVVEVADDQLEEQVKQAFEKDPLLDGTDIHLASVNQGVILLEGEAKSLSEQLRAVRAASRVPGARRVESQVVFDEDLGLSDEELSRPADWEEDDAGVRDAWITTEVKVRLMADSDVPALDVNVDTDDGVVTLFGEVPNEDARMTALRVARGVEGVEDVRDGLQIVAPKKDGIAAVAASDDDIEERVRVLLDDHSARFYGPVDGIEIEVAQGVVRLSGTVQRQADSLTAAALARSANGARSVMNDIKVQPGA